MTKPLQAVVQRRTSTVSFVACNSRKISEHATLTVIEPCTILSSPHHLSHLLPRLRAIADFATSKEQEMQNSFMCTIWSTWEHISCLAPNLDYLGNVRLIYFRPAQTISQGTCEPSGLSVPIHYTHAQAYSTKAAAGWTLHSGQIIPQVYNPWGRWRQLWAGARLSPSSPPIMTGSTTQSCVSTQWTAGACGQVWAGLLAESVTEVNFSTEAERRGLATQQFEFLSSVCQDTLSLPPRDLTQPLLSCIAKTCPTTQPCQVMPKAGCFLPIHIYTCVFTCHSQLGKLKGLVF